MIGFFVVHTQYSEKSSDAKGTSTSNVTKDNPQLPFLKFFKKRHLCPFDLKAGITHTNSHNLSHHSCHGNMVQYFSSSYGSPGMFHDNKKELQPTEKLENHSGDGKNVQRSLIPDGCENSGTIQAISLPNVTTVSSKTDFISSFISKDLPSCRGAIPSTYKLQSESDSLDLLKEKSQPVVENDAFTFHEQIIMSGQQKSALQEKPKVLVVSPQQVMILYMHKLTPYERTEILAYPQIYFIGANAKKRPGVYGPNNSDYDNEQGAYIHIPHDHVAYRYEMLKIIGKGSFGQVIKAYDHKTHEHVALKIVRNEKRFHRQAQEEIRILHHLRRHDKYNTMNIIHMFDYFTFRNHTCITFELLSINLYELIKKNGFKGFSLQLVRKFAHSLLQCLDALYKNEIIHCDMKPENVLLKQQGRSGIKENKMEHENGIATTPSLPSGNIIMPIKKAKSKRPKKCDYDNQNISMKRSFSKFDNLQKRNLIHVRSRDSSKAQEIFRNPTTEQRENCRQCGKPVYKMEETILQFKNEKVIFHKICLRCRDCSKQLKPESYHVHNGNLFCTVHFKLIFAPKIIHEESKPRKPELIIRENQPIELPPDVARASDKPNLGLEELQQLNVRSRYQVFENGYRTDNNDDHIQTLQRQDSNITQSTSISSKLSKLHKNGLLDTGEKKILDSDDNDDDDSDMTLMRVKKDTEKERPVGLGDAMNDIKTRFERGHMMAKEERREERKQEIQSIRSRLFMGKQAKIKEMYQQAVAESEQGITSVSKIPDSEIGVAARSIKDRFENGEMFSENSIQSKEERSHSLGLLEDADVFESAISKTSRSIFMELDANINTNVNGMNKIQNNRPDIYNKILINPNQNIEQENPDVDIIKSDAKEEDVKVTTAELSERFNFFEKFRPIQKEKRQFRMTPPRDGVVKLPTPDSDADLSDAKKTSCFNDTVLQKTQTASNILNKFRELEGKSSDGVDKPRKPNPLKCFTPPPENIYNSDRSESEEEQDSEDDESEFEKDTPKSSCSDQALKEAQIAARAKQLRSKFEKWQITEMEREFSEGRIDIYSQQVSNDSLESAKTIRERFENMNNSETHPPPIPRYQVNRFVS
ncbi:uncharacterized protein LOC108164387 isoform X5 [Drosophila miranda]|uniref:uncharacterized protein LOC108164387 isoform X5 n=1 Tax=Drosophila miranda TaxID=7229 RepID=UPI00143F619C|nr:uncharacterized protein LOC108164387 isoform X5 [Drosophila miranda]